MLRRVARFIPTLALFGIVALHATTAAAEPAMVFNVSTPAEPVQGAPGHQVVLPLRITNPGTHAIAVEIRQRALDLGDNGQVSVLDHADSTWGSHVQVPADPVTIPAGGYRQLDLRLRVPSVAPDTYLVGFLITPLGSGDGVRVVTAIGTYVLVDVPGPRDRRLDLALHAPTLSWSNTAVGDAVASNVGRSSLWYWGQQGDQRLPRAFLPAHRFRTITVVADSAMGLGVARLHLQLFYNCTDRQVCERDVARSVLLIHPAYPVATLALMFVTAVYFVRRHQRIRLARR